MKRFTTYLSLVLLTGLILMPAAYAGADNGTDKQGKFILSEVLALRCGLDSTNPKLTEDCIRRLAYDNKSGQPVGYSSYNGLRDAILLDYAEAYLYQAATGMVAGGTHEKRIDEMVGKIPTSFSPDEDKRENIKFNGELAQDNTAQLLDIVNLRASALNLNNIVSILEEIVPKTDVDLTKDAALRQPPQN